MLSVTPCCRHSGRVTIEEEDVKLLMNRQRITMGLKGRSLHDLARQYLPLESVEQLVPVALASNELIPVSKGGKGGRSSRKKKKEAPAAAGSNVAEADAQPLKKKKKSKASA
jgi:hypothetical protein